MAEIGCLGEMFVRGCAECPFLRRSGGLPSSAHLPVLQVERSEVACVLAPGEILDPLNLTSGAAVPAFCPLARYAGCVKVTLWPGRPR